ncbi:MAG: hypothetical protein ACT4OP_07815, partial [Actinomycetota bacterium]
MFSRRGRWAGLVVGGALGVLTFAIALAVEGDLRTAGQTVTINGAIYTSFNPAQSSGTGVFDAFLRVQQNVTEKGYNTDGTLEFDTKSGSHTHAIKLSAIPIFAEGSPLTLYREFQLDSNESSPVPATYYTLDTVEIYLTTNKDITGYPFGTGAELVYDMDALVDSEIILDSNINPGSGKRDMRLIVPEELFENATIANCAYGAHATCNTWVVLFTSFGFDSPTLTFDGTTDATFEEWGVAVYTGSKSGVKFHDQNNNGIRDLGEPGLSGWTIYVDLDDDGIHDPAEPSDVTDGTGAYSIGPIPPGTWKVKEVLMGGWICTFPSPCFYQETWGFDTAHEGNDFGNFIKINSTTVTAIHDAGHGVVLTV